MPDVIIYGKSFRELLHDAAWFTIHARGGADERHPLGEQRFTRSAILCAGLLVECTANCCINTLGLDKDSEKDLELSKTFTKFDAFLLATTGGKHVPRNHAIVRKALDLTSIRNGFVHPKITNIPYIEKRNVLELEQWRKWVFIDIPRNREGWMPVHAERAFVAVSDFLNYFFFELGGLDRASIKERSAVAQILHSEIEHLVIQQNHITPGKKQLLTNPSEELMTLQRRFDLDYAYLGYYAHNGRGAMLFPKRQLGEAINETRKGSDT